MDRKCQEAYIRLQEQLQKQLIRKGSKRSFLLNDRINENESRAGERKAKDKTYAFEEILTLAQSYGDEAFYDRMGELEQLANNILLVYQDDKQKKLKELIIKIRDGMKNE